MVQNGKRFDCTPGARRIQVFNFFFTSEMCDIIIEKQIIKNVIMKNGSQIIMSNSREIRLLKKSLMRT